MAVLANLDRRPIDAGTIRDPLNQPLAVFEATYARVKLCVRELEQAIA